MNLTKAVNTHNKIISLIETREIKNALDAIANMAEELQEWSIIEKINSLETNYKYMIHYFVEGQSDPQQESVYNHMIRDLYTISDDMIMLLQLKESSNVFFEKRRVSNIHQPMSIKEFESIFISIKDRLSITDLVPEGEDKDNRLKRSRHEIEEASKNIFDYIFISPRATDESAEKYIQLLSSDYIPVTTKCMIVSAITLNVLQQYDKRKIEVILDACNHEESEIAVRATIGLVTILRQYKNRWKYYPNLVSRLALMSDNKIFVKRLMSAILQFIQAHETEKITKKLTEEILPEMMKLSPMIGNKINLEEWMGESGLDDKNPEWQNIIQDTGLENKLKEFSEMQLGGADVFHSTFSNLKNYPFFSELSNWFMPFDKNHSSLQTMFSDKSEGEDLLSAMLSTSMMCNSDKYSLCFSIMQMPEQYRKMMISQMGAEGDELKKMAEEEFNVNPNKKEDSIFKQYVQDLYRFYKVYHRKGDFKDIFAHNLDFHKINPIYDIIIIPDNLQKIASHYFEKNNFDVALEAYLMLSEIEHPTSETWQKIGYCCQINGDIHGALKYYKKAELIDDNNSWLIRRIGACSRMIKEPESALQYYKRLEQIHPDDLGVQLNIGHCFLELKQYEEALNYYFKVDFLSNDNTRAWRSIAWCSFLSKKYDTAQKYYSLIIANKPNVNDYLNAGHVELCIGNTKSALDNYNQAVSMLGSFDKFKNKFDEDLIELINAGMNLDKLPLILDKVRYDNQ